VCLATQGLTLLYRISLEKMLESEWRIQKLYRHMVPLTLYEIEV
jgi:hypothetical protein